MQYKDGVIWAGHGSLMRSDDTGRTWRTALTPFMRPGEYITSICFVNRDTGVIATHTHVAYTDDGGVNWRVSQTLVVQSVTVSPDGKTVAAVEQRGSALLVSNDGAKTWSSHAISAFPTDIAYRRDGSLLLLAGYDPISKVERSLNGGATFTPTGAGFTGDSWSLSFDSCGAIYGVNEDYWAKNQSTCVIQRSSDDGATWTASFASVVPYLNGSMCTGPESFYAQTVTKGVIESINGGGSWHEISGPSQNADARTLCVLEGKYVIASDALGYVWRYKIDVQPTATTGPIIVRPLSLFASDTLSACDSLVVGIVITSTQCANQKLSGISIEGPDKSHYNVTGYVPSLLGGSDTLHIMFRAGALQDYHADLVLTFDGDSARHISLLGSGRAGANSLSYSTNALFEHDLLTPCDTPRVGVFHISDLSCVRHRVLSQKIVGRGANDYSIKVPLGDTVSINDSAVFLFYPNELGICAAQYVIILDDSTRIIAPLAGIGVETKSFAFFTQQKVFDTDTLTTCQPPLLRDIVLEDSACKPRTVDSVWIEGADKSLFSFGKPFSTPLLQHDTAQVAFACPGAGDFTATFGIRLSDGTVLTVPLSAHGVPPLFKTVSAIYDDTIGNDTRIPISFSLDKLPWDVDFSIRYDTALLDYRGTYTVDGRNIARLAAPGLINVQLPKNATGNGSHIMATTHFDFYPLRDSCALIVFDSFFVHDAGCLITDTRFVDTVCSTHTSNCTTPFITQIMRWPPLLVKIQPNPASASVSIHSSKPIDDAEVTITDALGKVCLTQLVSLSTDAATEIPIASLPAGLYGLQIRSGPQSVRMSLLHIR